MINYAISVPDYVPFPARTRPAIGDFAGLLVSSAVDSVKYWITSNINARATDASY